MFSQGMFNIGPNATPEQLEQNRRAIERMLPRGRAQYTGEGLTDLVGGILGGLAMRQNNRASDEVARRQRGAEMKENGEIDILQSAVALANQRAPQSGVVSGGAGDMTLAGGAGMDDLGSQYPTPPQAQPSPGMMPPAPPMPQGFNAAPVPAPNVPAPADQRAMSAGDPYDPEMMGQEMDAMRFERQPVDEKRQFRQSVRPLTTDEGRAVGAPSTGSGEAIIEDPDSELGMRMAVIPGSSAERERIAEQERAQQSQLYDGVYGDAVFDNIRRARELAENTWFTNGAIGNWTRNLGGSNANDMRALLTPINSAIGLDRLAAMREQSATGASGFGSLQAAELDLLVNGLYSLEQSQSEPQFLQNLDRVEESLAILRYGPPPEGMDRRTWVQQNLSGGRAQQGDTPPAPAGVDPADWQYMTPEERALFQ